MLDIQIMNGWVVIVLGLVLVGVGGFLGFYGSHLNNQASNDAASVTLTEKIGEVLAKIAEAKNSVQNTTTSPTQSNAADSKRSADQDIKKKKLDNIGEDFSFWAAGFLKNRSAKKLELDRLRETSKIEEKRISDQCRPIFQYAIEVLRGSMAAYNSTAGTNYATALKDLPANLYETDGESFDVGTIQFSTEAIWRVNVGVYRPPRDNSPPVFFVTIPSVKVGESSDSFRIEVRPTMLVLQTGGGGIAGTANVDSTPLISSYQVPLRAALERLLEAQITSLPPPS